MGKRGCLRVLAGVLLISIAMGVRDAMAVGGTRILMAEEGESSESGKDLPLYQGAGLDGRSSPTSEAQTNNQKPVGPEKLGKHVPKNTPPPGSPSNSAPASRDSLNPPAAPDKTSPLMPTSGLSNPAPVAGTPSHPPPAPGRPVSSSPSSGSPSNRPPPPGSPSHSLPASGGHSSLPPASGNNPTPKDGKLPNPVPSEHGREVPPNGKDGEKKDKKKQTGSSSGSDDSQGKGQENIRCNASTTIRCHVESLVACLLQPQRESQEWFLLVENEGENPLSVHVTAPASLKIDKTLPMPKRKSSKITFHADALENLHIVLNAGKGDCVLQKLPTSTFAGNLFQQLPHYANYATPIYGLSLASLTVVFAGGTWACCKFRKRRSRVDAGVAYQQLEMGTQPQSSASTDENVIDGWDETWNDDWDEEEAAPRPAEKQGSVSGNGVHFRSSNKNDWEDWDD